MYALNRLEMWDCLVSVVRVAGKLVEGEADAVAIASIAAIYRAMGVAKLPSGCVSVDWRIVDA